MAVCCPRIALDKLDITKHLFEMSEIWKWNVVKINYISLIIPNIFNN